MNLSAVTMPCHDHGSPDPRSRRPQTIVVVNEVHAHPRPYPPGGPMAMAMRVSPEDEAWIDAMRLRSYHLAVERGHLKR